MLYHHNYINSHSHIKTQLRKNKQSLWSWSRGLLAIFLPGAAWAPSPVQLKCYCLCMLHFQLTEVGQTCDGLCWYCLAALPGDALNLCHRKVRPFNPSRAEWDSLFTIHYGWRRGSAQLLLCLGEEIKHSKWHIRVVWCSDLLRAFHTCLFIREPKAGCSFRDQGGGSFLVHLLIVLILCIRNSIGCDRKVKALSLSKEICTLEFHIPSNRHSETRVLSVSHWKCITWYDLITDTLHARERDAHHQLSWMLSLFLWELGTQNSVFSENLKCVWLDHVMQYLQLESLMSKPEFG